MVRNVRQPQPQPVHSCAQPGSFSYSQGWLVGLLNQSFSVTILTGVTTARATACGFTRFCFRPRRFTEILTGLG